MSAGAPSRLRLDPRGAWVLGVRALCSPNCDDRPPGCTVDLLIVHGISLPPGEFGGEHIDRLFCNRLDPGAHPFFREVHALRVSAHVLVRRDGTLTQYVPITRRAWHAGVSSFQGRERCNDYSVGVELEGADHLAYTGAQYAVLADLAAALMRAYPAIDVSRLVGHSQVSPGRKSDPGPAFDWPRLRARVEVVRRQSGVASRSP